MAVLNITRSRAALAGIALIVWGALVIWAIVVATQIIGDDRRARDTVAERTDRELDRFVTRTDVIIDDVEAAANELGHRIATDPDDARAIEDHLEAVINRYPVLGAAGVAFAPFAFTPRDGASRLRLFAPVVSVTGSGADRVLVHGQIEDDYDYTRNYPWYGEAMKRGAHWSEPRAGERGGRPMVTYSKRILLKGDGSQPDREAVVFAALPQAPLREVVGGMALGEHGYGLLLSAGGLVMDHPEDRGAQSRVNVLELAPDLMRPEQPDQDGDYFARLGGWIADSVPVEIQQKQTSCQFEARSPVTGQKSTVTCRRIAGTGWVVAAVVGQDDLPVDHRERHRNLLLLTSLVVVVLLMLPVLDRLIRGPFLGDWSWSLFSTLILIGGIAAIWYWNMTESLQRTDAGTVVVGDADVDAVRHQWLKRAVLSSHDLPRFTHTGVYVQSVEFLSANNLLLTGYIWQRFAGDDEATTSPGFIMPEAETIEVEEAYRHRDGAETVVGWQFRVTLRQRFSYSHYPFDWETVWVRLWPESFKDNVILLPDLAAYRIMNPGTLPGVDRDLFIGGWTAFSSYFEYRTNSYPTNFGVDEDGVLQGRPELYFTIVIRRNFIDPFISNLTPIILVLLLIFAMLMTIQREARHRDLLGFNAATIITTCAALFFAVLISHIELRSSLSATQIFYLEYFYFVTYGAILLVCVNSILFTMDKTIPGIDYRDNLLPKLFFWPLVLAAMFMVTLFVFL